MKLTAYAAFFGTPPLVRSEYDRLADFMIGAYSYSTLFPPEMSEWRELAHRRRLEMHFPWDQLLAVSLQLVSAGCPMPANLADVNLSELHAMASASPFPVAFRAVWPTARAAFAPPFPLPGNTSSLLTSSSLRTASSLQFVGTLRKLPRRAKSLCAQRGNSTFPAPLPGWGPPIESASLARPTFFLARLIASRRTPPMPTC